MQSNERRRNLERMDLDTKAGEIQDRLQHQLSRVVTAVKDMKNNVIEKTSSVDTSESTMTAERMSVSTQQSSSPSLNSGRVQASTMLQQQRIADIRN